MECYLYNFIQKRQEVLSQQIPNKKAVSIPEILFIFSVFVFVLYILFPKETLKQKVLKESKSNDLAIVYIENMIKFDDKNYELLFHFADIHFKEEHFEAVKGIVNFLLQSNLVDIQTDALLLGEKLFKREYFLMKNQKDREKLLNEYSELLEDMLFVSKDEKFQHDILNFFMQSDDKSRYIKALKRLSKIDLKWKEKLAEYYVANQNLEQALELYKDILYNSIQYQDKRVIFLKILKVLMYGSFYKEGIVLMKKYEEIFLKDNEVFKEIIHFYIVAGEEKKARRYILKRGEY